MAGASEADMTRQVLSVSGSDAAKFLGDLVTNVLPGEGKLGYNALLSPQGKYLFDFFVLKHGEAFWLDIAAEQAQAFGRRLMMYKLRADVQIEAIDVAVSRGLTDQPPTAFEDPRDPRLGWRDYDGAPGQEVDWDEIRVAALIPETGRELIPDDSYIIELGFERLNGIDFKKGCYVGQEVMARMKHKTELRKGLARVALSQQVPAGSEISKDGKTVGTIHTVSGEHALAYVRFDRADGPMTAGEATVVLEERA